MVKANALLKLTSVAALLFLAAPAFAQDEDVGCGQCQAAATGLTLPESTPQPSQDLRLSQIILPGIFRTRSDLRSLRRFGQLYDFNDHHDFDLDLQLDVERDEHRSQY
ncbi:hypothetical protein EST38_g10813 [Candolleomyces aberdarensis]|uniref:Uncharacterized protein n=1 Tax=Candolleomyces aberdarensis TaxID=2316362 RepID=A0A4Q2D6G6_9AGAR|nr:hypothetical protein EST38_g10813 [Candolleomyces aberdarensis]